MLTACIKPVTPPKIPPPIPSAVVPKKGTTEPYNEHNISPQNEPKIGSFLLIF